MPDPRTIALEKNDRSKFQENLDDTYDAVGGCPKNNVQDHVLEEARPQDPQAGKEST
jgi:hypothetical protein